MANTTLPRYHASGFFRPTTIALFLAGTVGGVLVAFVYDILTRWIPFIYLNALICAGFGFVLGFAATWAVKSGHCRNRMIALVLTLPLAGVSLGATYFWGYRSFLSEVQKEHPEIPMEAIKTELPFQKYLELKQEAGWTVGRHGSSGGKFNGAGVLVIWGIEALVVLGIALFMANHAATEPYCERCNQWGEERKMMIYGVGRESADPLLSSGDLGALVEMQQPAEGDHSMALKMTATICLTCKETGFLTVEETRVDGTGKKAKEKSVELVRHAVLRADQRAKFLARIEGPAEPPAAAAANG